MNVQKKHLSDMNAVTKTTAESTMDGLALDVENSIRWREQKITRNHPIADGTAALVIQPEDFEKKKNADEFELIPLTKQQRKALGIEQYYRPFHVDKQTVLSDQKVYWMGKRAFDVVCASIALIALSPIILIVLFAVFIEDPTGSPIFVQQRIGKGGKLFAFIKIRSMYTGAEKKLEELLKDNQAQGKAFKMKDDPRITKVGKFIRNTSIDELLQLVNIIKGDMSIVGPRPPLPREVALYDEYEKQRFIVTPGLTCFWQVYPRRHEISFEDWVALDVKYVVERNWRTDLGLIFRTIGTVLKGNAD